MIVLNPRFIAQTSEGLYAQYATDNLNELRQIMKDLIIKYPEESARAYKWISNETQRWANTTDAATQTSTSQTGSGLLYKKKGKKVKTFSL